MITRGIGNSLLQVGKTSTHVVDKYISYSHYIHTFSILAVRSVNPLLHHSFGDKENFELPHITGPLWSSVDRLMVL